MKMFLPRLATIGWTGFVAIAAGYGGPFPTPCLLELGEWGEIPVVRFGAWWVWFSRGFP